ncbi:NAD(P)H-binding protein [Saccharopolyspora taberi]|uniref:NAD(P)H-binding protein n=1 Tax=Saccharopolyspora taberi TaxID=60895 RepID=A0ABN3VJP0_9PSEU
MTSILVLAASGKTGRRIVPRLQAAGHSVKAASRSSEVRFDWTDRSTWSGALSGTTAVYLVVPDEPVAVDDFVQQAVAAGVTRFVALSGRGVDIYKVPGMHAAEEAVRASGVEWTILRANNFAQNFDEDLWLAPLQEGELALPIKDERDPFVDLEDVADVAAAVLTEDGHAGRVYELSGPRALDFGEAVDLVAKATGRTIRFVSQSSEEYVAGQVARGVPAEAAQFLDMIMGVLRDGHIAAVTDGVRQVLGREPRSFESYVERTAATGVWG